MPSSLFTFSAIFSIDLIDLMGESKAREITALCYWGYIKKYNTDLVDRPFPIAKLAQIEKEGEGKKPEVLDKW